MSNLPIPDSRQYQSLRVCGPGVYSVHVGTVVEIKPEPCDGRGHVAGREVSTDADAVEAINRPY